MGTIPSEMIEQIAAANDIVDVIGSYFPLKRAGANFKALCPFHQEKTPSFMVSPSRQTFHCVGCGAGGSVFRFVMDYEHVDFPSAVRKLAARAGITVVEKFPAGGAGDEERQRELRQRLLKLHAEAAQWFHEHLIRRVAELPALRDLHCNPSGPQIFSRRFAYFSFDQMFVEPLRSLSMQLQQTLAQFALPLFIARPTPARLLDHRNASSRREFADGGGKIDMLVIHHKPKDAPACAAAETMKRLPARTHQERRRPFPMKGSER